MSYELAVLCSIVRSLLAGAACLWIARGLVDWRNGERARQIHHGDTEARRSDQEFYKGSGHPLSATRHAPTKNHEPRTRELLLLIPFFMPGLVVGYAYRNASLSLVQTPWLNELMYLAIIVAQLTPVAVLTLEWLPAAEMSGAGAFLLGQALQQPWRQRIRAVLAGEGPRQITSFAIAALLCFQEVEVATLMQARGWAEWIFTKQTRGGELSEVWRFLLLPVGYGLGLVVPVLWYWLGRRETRGERREPEVPSAVPQSSTLNPQHFYLLLAWPLVVVWPVASLAIGAFRGRDTIHLRTPIWWEIGDALIQAGTVTALLWGLFRLIDHYRQSPSSSPLPPGEGPGVREPQLRGDLRTTRPSENVFDPLPRNTDAPLPVTNPDPQPLSRGERGAGGFWGRGLFVVLIVPGLLGSLALGLAVFEICQRIGVQPAYSPVPLVAAMVLFLLPRALAMRMMLHRSEGQSNLFLARQMGERREVSGQRREVRDERLEPAKEPEAVSGNLPSAIRHPPVNPQLSGRSIVWRLHGAGRFWTLAILFWWSYLELTLPSLLRPAGMAPAPMRLYNFLHYGHIPGLAAMLVVVLGVPVLGGSLWLMAYRKIFRS